MNQERYQWANPLSLAYRTQKFILDSMVTHLNSLVWTKREQQYTTFMQFFLIEKHNLQY